MAAYVIHLMMAIASIVNVSLNTNVQNMSLLLGHETVKSAILFVYEGLSVDE